MNSEMVLPHAMEMERELRRELAAGEQIIWSGLPDPRRMRLAFVIWLFAIPWTLFSLAWTGIALSAVLSGKGENAGLWWTWIFPLWGTPFIAVGLYMLSMPFRIRAALGRSIYALTSQRVLQVETGKTRKVTAVALSQLGAVSRTEGKDGWGTLSIVTGSHVDSDGDRVTDKFEFHQVPDVARLERLLTDAQAYASSR